MRWLKAFTGIGIGLVVAGIAPVVPQDLKWVASYETISFDTADGDLDLDQYAIVGDGYYIRTVPKDEGQFIATTSKEAITGKTEIQIACEKCVYYDEFTDGKRTYRDHSDATKYDKLRAVKDTPQPSKTIFVTPIEAVVTEAAIAYDTTTVASVNVASSVSFSHVTTGSNTVLVVSSSMFDSATDANRDITNVTYNSVALTSLRRDNDDTTNVATEMWYKAAPSSGSNTVAITYAGTLAAGEAFSTSLTGVDQTSPLDAQNGIAQQNSMGATTTVTTVGANTWIISNVMYSDGSGGATTSPANGEVTRKTAALPSSGGIGGLATKIVLLAGATSSAWNCGPGTIFCDATDDWTVSAASFLPAAPAPPTPSPAGSFIFDE